MARRWERQRRKRGIEEGRKNGKRVTRRNGGGGGGGGWQKRVGEEGDREKEEGRGEDSLSRVADPFPFLDSPTPKKERGIDS